jgi:hypothetical protein
MRVTPASCLKEFELGLRTMPSCRLNRTQAYFRRRLADWSSLPGIVRNSTVSAIWKPT